MAKTPDLERVRELLGPPLVPIIRAGEALGLSPRRAYAAAKSGQIPTATFGKYRKAVTAPIKRMLGLELT
jgi:hypothetical protein